MGFRILMIFVQISNSGFVLSIKFQTIRSMDWIHRSSLHIQLSAAPKPLLSTPQKQLHWIHAWSILKYCIFYSTPWSKVILAWLPLLTNCLWKPHGRTCRAPKRDPGTRPIAWAARPRWYSGGPSSTQRAWHPSAWMTWVPPNRGPWFMTSFLGKWLMIDYDSWIDEIIYDDWLIYDNIWDIYIYMYIHMPYMYKMILTS